MMDWDKGKYLNRNFMITLEICQKQALDTIAMTPTGTLGLCSHYPINDTSECLHTIVYFAVMLKASWHSAQGS